MGNTGVTNTDSQYYVRNNIAYVSIMCCRKQFLIEFNYVRCSGWWRRLSRWSLMEQPHTTYTSLYCPPKQKYSNYRIYYFKLVISLDSSFQDHIINEKSLNIAFFLLKAIYLYVPRHFIHLHIPFLHFNTFLLLLTLPHILLFNKPIFKFKSNSR